MPPIRKRCRFTLWRRDDALAGNVHMLNTTDLHYGWRSALQSLAENFSRTPIGHEPRPEGSRTDDGDDELEPFHLDDLELANRLMRDRSLIHYSTPPHAHLLFPLAVQR